MQETIKVDLSGANTIPDGDVVVSAEQLRALMEKAESTTGLQQQLAQSQERIALIAPVASAGLELARKDISPEETKIHLATLIDADGSYTPQERDSYLGTVGQIDPVTEPTNTITPPLESDPDMSTEQINALQARLDALESGQQTASSQATHANATILKQRMHAQIERAIAEDNFAGGVVGKRRSMYTEDEDGLGVFNGTISGQVEKATMALLRNELSLGATLETLDVESIVNRAAEQVGGSLQTVIGEGGVGPLAETVSGQSQFTDVLNEMGVVKAPTTQEISSASDEEMSELVDRQEQSSLQDLLKTAASISPTSGQA